MHEWTDSPSKCPWRLPHRRLIAVTWIAVVGVLLTAGQTRAEDVSTLLTDRLLGPECAVRFEPMYYGEVFTNTRGGLRTKGATQYLGLLEFPVIVDFEKTQSSLPGRFYVLAQTTHGRGLSRDFVGDMLVLSNIDSFRNITRVSEYWWEFVPFEYLTLRVGKQDLNTEFLYMSLAEDFIQSTYGLSPSTAFPTYPDQSMGIVA